MIIDQTTKPFRLSEMVSLGRMSNLGLAQESAAEAIRVNPPEHFLERKGYSASFLGESSDFTINLPKIDGSSKDDLAPLLDGSGHILNYRNFSVVMSKSRKIAFFTACNIDGAKSRRIIRDRDRWFYDGRIDQKYQIGDELYTNNDLDRGHLVRREDPVWGELAEEANEDTFHFTNCSPQHSGLNQKTWLGLEDYILKNARTEGLKVTVFTGPVFRDDDMVYRGIHIPKEYWKVVAIISQGRRSATAYMISQDKLITDLEFVFGKYKTYQVSIRHIQELTQLNFDGLDQFDGFSGEELATGVTQRTEIDEWQAIRI